MGCFRRGGCGPYEGYSCTECPASKPEYAEKRKTPTKIEMDAVAVRDRNIRILRTENGELRDEIEAKNELLRRAKDIMLFHSSRCNVNPMVNYSGSEEHCVEYRVVVAEIDKVLALADAPEDQRGLSQGAG